MLHVHFLPALTTPADLAGGLVVVIDVLRASTTICHALAAGASAVIPCLQVDEAQQIAEQMPRGTAVLGGERGGLRIEGFDFGNSPREYAPETVAERTVVFTTTNGTQAMRQCVEAARVLVGAFVNLSAVCREVFQTLQAGGLAHLLCAGTRGEITGEDVLFAGAVVHQVMAGVNDFVLNDQAQLAWDAWRAVLAAERTNSAAALAEHLARNTRGGQNVTRLGLGGDILDAATIDRFDFAPELILAEWRITRSISQDRS